MYKETNCRDCKKYTDRSVNEVYSKLVCDFSNTCCIPGKPGRKGDKGIKGDRGIKGERD